MPDGYRIVRLSRSRRVMAGLLEVARKRRIILGFTEADVTEARALIRDLGERTGESISLTAYVAACLARTVALHPMLNAARRGRRLLLFDEVDVVCYLEQRREGEKVVGFLTLRAADRASVRELSERFRTAQARGTPMPPAFRRLPMWLFTAAVRWYSRNPKFLAQHGVISISNVGAESAAPGWGFAPSATTVEVTLGGMAKRPALVDGELCEREHLCLTVAFDHDIVDGAEAARFTSTFVDLVSSGAPLRELLTSETTVGS